MADNKIIDGKLVAEAMKKEIAAEVADMIDKGIGAPHLAAVIVGDDGASLTYVASKEKACQKVGMISSVYRLNAKSTEEDVLNTINFLNNDPEIDGYIVQLPLPDHINETKVIQSINPDKDVDGFTLKNIGLMQLGEPCFLPATPFGIIELLKRSNIEISGKHVVVMGRSNIVGSPISVMLSRKGTDATVTICHTKTQNIKELTKQADILVVAIGQPEFVKADMVKEGAVVIDVGIHRIKDNSEKGYHVVGDVDFNDVYPKVSKITPVPGGVGPMTIVSLLHNTLMSAKKNR
ncbi:MAG: bifunctional 5,10-methylene-tetrahydrofolate dehydrogenase/5,10-methylene-tetrahydrofolate cyclohydrolase [Bacteroidales bacterium]|nr:bifunctional 5,10-methylene-tetrahydrofolate dehydrogenase/5,10-methylene-tetrahydrofolate cyclohydrolase [Bacteroidales bacterium]